MRYVWILPLMLALWGEKSGQAAESPDSRSAPLIDKHKLEDYIRYAEGFASSVKFSIDDPVASPLQGYYRLLVHLSMGETREDKLYYLTADGQHLLTGPIWDINSNPFIETLAQLPSDGPSFGPADAKYTLVVFSDFECPYCREFARTLRNELPRNYKDVKVIFKDFPIDSLHPWARAASEAAHCVGDSNSDAFWSFHDWVFEHQGEINAKDLKEKTLEFANEHKLDAAKIGSCIDNRATRAEVDASVKEGHALDISKTPTFFLDGREVPGALAWPALNSLLKMEIDRPSSIPAAQGK